MTANTRQYLRAVAAPVLALALLGATAGTAAAIEPLDNPVPCCWARIEPVDNPILW